MLFFFFFLIRVLGIEFYKKTGVEVASMLLFRLAVVFLYFGYCRISVGY